MKFVEPSHCTDPDAAAHKLVEIAHTTEGVQDGRIFIELINAAFLEAGGSPVEFRGGIERAVAKGWLWRHESGVYVKFSPGPGPTCSTESLEPRSQGTLTAPRQLRCGPI